MQSPLVRLFGRVTEFTKRDFGIFVPFLQKANDPIQQLFLDKLREYKQKSAGGKLVDPSPELEKELKNDRERIMKQYGVTEVDTKFPSFKFPEPTWETPGLTK